MPGAEQANTAAVRRNNHLLFIAIDKYQKVRKLSNCVRDARAVLSVLLEKYDFKQEHVITLFDHDATKAKVFSTLRHLVSSLTEQDNLLIYFAGHGAYDKTARIGYLVPVEAKNYWEFISNEDLLSYIRAMKTFHTFLLVDSCFSGTLFMSRNIGDAEKLAEKVEQFPSRWGLAAGRIERVADGLRGDNSPFAKAVLGYFTTNNSRSFPVSELVQYVKRVTPRNAEQTPVGGPLFKVGDLDGEFVFHLKQDEKSDWHHAQKAHTIEAYRLYLKNYPQGAFSREARAAIKAIEAENLWQDIRQKSETDSRELQQKLDLLERYVDAFEDEKHYADAIEEGRRLKCKKEFLAAQNDKFELLAFLQKNPPFYKEEAQKRLDEIRAEDRKKQKKKPPREKPENVKRETVKKPPRKKSENIKRETARKPQKQQTTEITIGDLFEKLPSWSKYGLPALLAILLIYFLWPSGGVDTSMVEQEGLPELEGSASSLPPVLRQLERNMVFVQGGRFTMGCTEEQGGDCYGDESPAHEVELSNYYIGKYEVTNEEYALFLNEISDEISLDENGDAVTYKGNIIFDVFCGTEKGGCTGFKEMIEYTGGSKPGGMFRVVPGYEKHPVVLVSWYGARAYASWLSEKTGKDYRLPTEAEWEYAARGGQKSKGYKYAGTGVKNELYRYANFCDANCGEGWKDGTQDDGYAYTAAVGQFLPNELGLYDMSGNVWEWCYDWYGDEYYKECKQKGVVRNPTGPVKGSARVARGGGWPDDARHCRVSDRDRGNPGSRYDLVGFRLVRSSK